MRSKRTNPDFLNGVPELLVLSLLSRREMHGYELVQSIRRATNEVIEFGEGCVYPTVHRLEADGLLTSSRSSVAGRSRVVYRLSARGRKQLTTTRSTWEIVVAAIKQALEGDDDERTVMA